MLYREVLIFRIRDDGSRKWRKARLHPYTKIIVERTGWGYFRPNQKSERVMRLAMNWDNFGLNGMEGGSLCLSLSERAVSAFSKEKSQLCMIQFNVFSLQNSGLWSHVTFHDVCFTLYVCVNHFQIKIALEILVEFFAAIKLWLQSPPATTQQIHCSQCSQFDFASMDWYELYFLETFTVLKLNGIFVDPHSLQYRS